MSIAMANAIAHARSFVRAVSGSRIEPSERTANTVKRTKTLALQVLCQSLAGLM